jgi:alpha-1,3-mannosyltransferase
MFALLSAKLYGLMFKGLGHIEPHFIVSTLFVSNFIGIVFARTLHYQFYSWYFHTVPYLLWGVTKLPTFVCIAVVCAIEFAFNVYPATAVSSLVLQVCT